MDKRVLRAVELFKMGYNCSQSVVGAYADIYGYSLEQALLMSASFGAGIGRMREVCGAACGMFLLAGFETGCTNPTNTAGKADNYRTVQFLAAEFKKINGTIICAELLGLKPKSVAVSPVPEPRTEEYYKKRPCVETVKSAAIIYGEFLAKLPNK
ncbi:MAG: C-GCAxxG-C-C family protein [Bacteroidales bacterium]